MFNRKEYMKKYREDHKGEISEYRKQYRQDHLIQEKQCASDYRSANLEFLLKRCNNYKSTHKKEISNWRKEYHAEHRDRAAEVWIKRTYGIDAEEYSRMLLEQGGVCAICGNPPGKRKLAIDHDHSNGKIRALLCHRCNMGLGDFNDSPDLLRRAIQYLEHSKDEL